MRQLMLGLAFGAAVFLFNAPAARAHDDDHGHGNHGHNHHGHHHHGPVFQPNFPPVILPYTAGYRPTYVGPPSIGGIYRPVPIGPVIVAPRVYPPHNHLPHHHH